MNREETKSTPPFDEPWEFAGEQAIFISRLLDGTIEVPERIPRRLPERSLAKQEQPNDR